MKNVVIRIIDWLGSHELTVLTALFVVVAGSWMFIMIADRVSDGETQALDERIVRAMRLPDDPQTPIGPHWMVEIGRDITALGGYAVLIMVTAAVIGFLFLDRKFHAMWFVIGAVLSGFFVTMGLKKLFDRPRPDVVGHLSQVHTSSFPSGHSMMSAVVYLTLGVLLATLVRSRRLRFYFIAIAVSLSAFVGVSRVYMGVHYPTDVLAGWSAGLVWATFCWLIARRLQRKGTIEQEL